MLEYIRSHMIAKAERLASRRSDRSDTVAGRERRPGRVAMSESAGRLSVIATAVQGFGDQFGGRSQNGYPDTSPSPFAPGM